MIRAEICYSKHKKVLYFYDESGNRKLLGVFDKKKASQIKKKLRDQNLINRLTEFEIRTTEPDNYVYTEEF